MRCPLILLALPTLLLVACSSTARGPGPSAASSARPGGAAPSGCVDTATARQVWTTVNTRLNSIVLDPTHAGLDNVTTGNALTQVKRYIQDTLVSKNLTEREVDTLDSLDVVAAGCDNGPLTVAVLTTVTKDDYLKSDGSVDHSDPAVGTQLHLQETFVRANGSWKEADVSDLSQPTPSASGTVI